jgi:hypothetical protein
MKTSAEVELAICAEIAARKKQHEALVGHMITGRQIADGSHAKICLEERIKALKWVLGVIDG